MHKTILSFAAAVTTTLAIALTASAAEVGESNMRLGYRVLAPAGFRTYCERSPSDCIASGYVAQRPRMEVGGEMRGVSSSLWPSAFVQIRAGRDYPTGSIPGADHAEAGLARWRLRAQEGAATTVLALPTPPLATTYGPELQIPAPSIPTRIVLDAAAKRMLQHVNQSINASIRPANDDTINEGDDVWGGRTGADGVMYGDCEDYVLAKRKALLNLGVPAAALSIALAHNGDSQTHAVLVISTDRGDYILDNLSFWVRPWTELPYAWIMRQNHGDAADWREIVGADKVRQTPARISRDWW